VIEVVADGRSTGVGDESTALALPPAAVRSLTTSATVVGSVVGIGLLLRESLINRVQKFRYSHCG